LAGYRVYRSETEGTRGPSLTPELQPTPTYRDANVRPGQRYWYTVTALDRAGNESTDSAAVAAEIPQSSQ
jgi:fibronectin type 3 domain-containing protein